WFIGGTEPLFPAAVGESTHQGILYPPSGTVFALDPDIPPGLQKIFFILQKPSPEVNWVLNGKDFPSRGKATPWTPEAGRYHLELRGERGIRLDSVTFEVRGAAKQGTSGGLDEFSD
ncbi:MAG TPA: hypothetical protein VLS90_19690, partial [Thermodesulfobacteriota bacterium]|nr:hypothetical protein [Thermodesulfobacteriota bacterium]